MKINIITIFPEVIENILSMGVLGIAKKKVKVEYDVVNPRDFTTDAHRTVDDAPYGGSPGMVMMVEPLYKAVKSLELAPESPVILLSPSGRCFDQGIAHELSEKAELTFICGRYKGVDERIRELVVTDEISIGDFVLSGGELAAAACIEAIVRLLEGVLGNKDSGDTDSFEQKINYLLDCAYYTRPEKFMGLRVPQVLISGNHEEIRKWRERSSLERTRASRPDLINNDKR